MLTLNQVPSRKRHTQTPSDLHTPKHQTFLLLFLVMLIFSYKSILLISSWRSFLLPQTKTSQEQCVSNSNTKNYFGILNISRMSEAQIILSLTNIFISLGTHEYFFCCLLCMPTDHECTFYPHHYLMYLYLNQS